MVVVVMTRGESLVSGRRRMRCTSLDVLERCCPLSSFFVRTVVVMVMMMVMMMLMTLGTLSLGSGSQTS
jgi:hypothetical protein